MAFLDGLKGGRRIEKLGERIYDNPLISQIRNFFPCI